MLINNDLSSISMEPSISRKYGLGTQNAYKNPIGTFLLELFQEHITTIPPNVLFSMPSSKFHHNQTGITIVEVEDLRQTIAIETHYRRQMPG
jgi:hypothetical protein